MEGELLGAAGEVLGRWGKEVAKKTRVIAEARRDAECAEKSGRKNKGTSVLRLRLFAGLFAEVEDEVVDRVTSSMSARVGTASLMSNLLMLRFADPRLPKIGSLLPSQRVPASSPSREISGMDSRKANWVFRFQPSWRIRARRLVMA